MIFVRVYFNFILVFTIIYVGEKTHYRSNPKHRNEFQLIKLRNEMNVKLNDNVFFFQCLFRLELKEFHFIPTDRTRFLSTKSISCLSRNLQQ